MNFNPRIRDHAYQSLIDAFPVLKLDGGVLSSDGDALISRAADIATRLERGELSEEVLRDMTRLLAERQYMIARPLPDSDPPRLASEAISSPDEVQSLLRETGSFLSADEWLLRRRQREAQVCQVWVDKDPGTGFLVADDVILTNFHVVQRIIEKEVGPEQVVVQFEGDPPSRRFHLAYPWILDKSPPSEVDWIIDPTISRVPTTKELDYAFLLLDGTPGAARGHIPLPALPHRFLEGSPLYVIQHPYGGPLQIALQRSGVLSINSNRTRVRYKTWVHDGSSGSPCFDKDWKLVAIHHGGDMNLASPAYNQGIPIDTIRSHMSPGVRARLRW